MFQNRMALFLAAAIVLTGCSKTDPAAYTGSYHADGVFIDVYQDKAGLMLRSSGRDAVAIRPSADGKLKGQDRFSSLEGERFMTLSYNGINYSRYIYSPSDAAYSLNEGAPSSMLARALSLEVPENLAGGSEEDFALLNKDMAVSLALAGEDNRFGFRLYESNNAFLCRTPAEALQKVQAKLRDQGFGLMVFDAYRPWFVSWLMWNSVKEPIHFGLADPAVGEDFNSGAAVDVTLYELESGLPTAMTSSYGDLSYRSSPEYLGGTLYQRECRELLSAIMKEHGFEQDSGKWWHFVYRDQSERALRNESFSELSIYMED